MGGALRQAAAGYAAAIGLLGGILALQGCTTTPSIEAEAKQVPISAIVERVKCEIWEATKSRLADPRFAFLKKWDATVDLTLIVNNQAGISPGVSVIAPLKSVTEAAKGTFSQSFSMGLGGGVTGQANLSDTVSFSLSLSDLAHVDTLNREDVRKRYYNRCLPLQENDLLGKLGFKEWIDQVLLPIDDPAIGFRYLTPGMHPSVKGGGPSIARAVEVTKERLDKLKPPPTTQEHSNATQSAPSANGTEAPEAIEQIEEKISPDKLAQHPEEFEKLVSEQCKKGTRACPALRVLQTAVRNAKKPKPPQSPQMNDPIDTISHQIQFIVTWNANATPGWSLVNVKGPSPASGSFLSGQHQTTHQLLITMGPVKSEVQSVRATQQFNAALQRLNVSPSLQ